MTNPDRPEARWTDLHHAHIIDRRRSTDLGDGLTAAVTVDAHGRETFAVICEATIVKRKPPSRGAVTKDRNRKGAGR